GPLPLSLVVRPDASVTVVLVRIVSAISTVLMSTLISRTREINGSWAAAGNTAKVGWLANVTACATLIPFPPAALVMLWARCTVPGFSEESKAIVASMLGVGVRVTIMRRGVLQRLAILGQSHADKARIHGEYVGYYSRNYSIMLIVARICPVVNDILWLFWGIYFPQPLITSHL